MSDLVSEQFAASVRIWYENGEKLLREAELRIRKAAGDWGLTKLTPLTGGGYSIVCSGIREEKEVIVKANLKPNDSIYEKIGLQTLQSQKLMPEVLDYSYGVLLLEKLPGSMLSTYDGEVIADVLGTIHENPKKPTMISSKVPTWENRAEEFFYSYARRCVDKKPQLKPLVDSVASHIPKLLNSQHYIIHGDVLRKNILQSNDGTIHVIDPLTTISPLGWEFAHSACSIQVHNNTGEIIVEKGLSLNVENLESWLQVAMIHHVLNQDDTKYTERLENLNNLITRYKKI